MNLFDKKWKGKNGVYTVRWCELCDVASIRCLEKDCSGSTCNSGGCSMCKDDFEEFHTYTTHVYAYLTEEEKRIYEKTLRLKHFIMETIPTGMKRLDWKKLDSEEKLSGYDGWMFLPEIYGKKPT